MRLVVRLAAASAGLSLCLSALAYGAKGHQMIGAIADAELSPAARAAVAKSLGFPLRSAATWADCVRDVEKHGNQFVYNADVRFAAACKPFLTKIGKDRMISYARRNWAGCADPAAHKGCHALYHFADVAIQHDRYDRAFMGTSDHDIVSAIKAAIAKLQGGPVPAPFDIKDKAEAMLMLAHFVGDLHQPLHVGSVYLDSHDKPVDPGAAGAPLDPRIDTRGGNKLEVGSSSNLHTDWDGVQASWDPLHPTKEILGLAAAVAPTAGDIQDWPAAWASETVKASQGAYAPLSFSHTGAKSPGEWVTAVADSAAYAAQRNAVQKREMATAGARLAQIMNAIWP